MSHKLFPGKRISSQPTPVTCEEEERFKKRNGQINKLSDRSSQNYNKNLFP